MKINMKQLLLLTASIFLTQLMYAQTQVSYTYDDAGNRITRQTVTLKIPDDEYKDNYDKTTHVEDKFGKGNITIYPNPTEELLTVQFTNIKIEEKILLQLYDINGKLIKSKKTKNYKTTINLSNNTAGMYILKIISGKSKAEFMVVKE